MGGIIGGNWTARGGSVELKSSMSVGGNVLVEAQNGILVRADVVTPMGTIAIGANRDGVGSEGFEQTGGGNTDWE